MMKTIPYLCLFLLLFNFGCHEQEAEAVDAVRYAAPEVKESKSKDYARADEEVAAVTERNAEMDLELPAKPEIETKIIREANLEFETNDLETTHSRITDAVKKYGALVQSDSQSNTDYKLSRDISVRVPSDHFDAFIADISKGVGYFDRKEISARDVTEEFIDTEARLKNKKALELRYLELLKKATKVSEMLEIEEKLSDVREEIESTEGQLKYMQSRVSMSVVNLSFYKPVAAQSNVTSSYGSKMWNALAEGFYGISGFLLGLLYIWPIIIILVALIFLVRRRLRRKKNL
jgi:hypothetical protein